MSTPQQEGASSPKKNMSAAERNAATTINYERQQQQQGSPTAGGTSSPLHQSPPQSSPQNASGGAASPQPEALDAGGTTPQNAEGEDDWKQVEEAVTKQFTNMSVDGFITGYELMDICESMSIAIDEEIVRQMVPSFDHIDLENTLDVIAQLRTTGKTQGYGKGTELSAVETVLIGPMEYICRKITCEKDPPNIVYKMRSLSLDLQPRQVLVGSTGTLMFIMGFCIIGVMAIVWLNTAQNTEKRIVMEFGRAVGSFINGFERQMMSKNGEEQRDMARTVNHYVDVKAERSFAHEHNRTRLRIERLRSATETIAGIDVMTMQVDDVRGALGVANRIARLYDARNIDPVPRVASLIRNKLLPRLPSWHFTLIEHNFNLMNYAVVADSHPGICNGSTTPQVVCRFSVVGVEYAQNSRVGFWPHSIDLTGRSAISLSIEIHLAQTRGMTHLILLASLRQSVFEANMRARIKTTFPVLSQQLVALGGASAEIVLATLDPSSSIENPAIVYETPLKFQPGSCLELGVCGVEQQRAIYSALRQRAPIAVYGKDRTGALARTLVVPTQYDIAYASALHIDASIDAVIQETITVFDSLNQVRIFELGFTIETVVVTRNASTGRAAQASHQAFFGDCIIAGCLRTPMALVNAENGFSKKDAGYSVAPDYRPEPVMGGYSYSVHELTNIVVMVERDVTEIRHLTLMSLVKMIDSNNAKFIGTFEIQILYRKGLRFFTFSYDPNEPCPRTESCVKVDGIGTVVRSDCLHCSRQEPFDENKIVHLTKLKFEDDCYARGINCSAFQMESSGGIGRMAMNSQFGEGGIADNNDYRDVRIYGYYGNEANFSVSYYLKQDYSEIFDPITFYILVSLGSSAAIVLAMLVVLTVLSRRMVLQIEDEWMRYKEQITAERAAFGDLVREVLPGHIAEEIMKGKMLNVSSINICLAFIDVSGSMGRAKSWQAQTFCRYNTYVLHVVETLAVDNKVHRVRTIGDTTVLVSGLNETEHDTQKDNVQGHYIVRMVRCCALVLKLATRRYAHFPHRCDIMQQFYSRNSFEFPDLDGQADLCGFLAMPTCKIGIHAGVGNSVVVNAGRTPNFDVLGATPALAMRLASTSKPGNCHVSDAVKEHVEKTIPIGLYDEWYSFTTGVKTVIRGRGTVQSFFVKEANVSVNVSLTKELGVRFAKRRFMFEHSKMVKSGGSKAGSSIRGGSSVRQSIASSNTQSERSFMTASSEHSSKF